MHEFVLIDHLSILCSTSYGLFVEIRVVAKIGVMARSLGAVGLTPEIISGPARAEIDSSNVYSIEIGCEKFWTLVLCPLEFCR